MIFSSYDNKQSSDRMGNQQDDAPQPQQQQYADIPPTYEVAVEETSGLVRVQPQFSDQKIPPQDPVAVYRSYQSHTPDDIPAGPSVPRSGIPSMPQTRVYHYVNPANGNHFTSLLPPDHPEMVCLQQGSHVKETKFGWVGIIAAVVWFPLGIGLCLLDRTVTCKRCGAVIKARPSI